MSRNAGAPVYDVIHEPGPPCTSAEDLLAGFLIVCDRNGIWHYDARLLRWWFWWEDLTVEQVTAWRDELIASGVLVRTTDGVDTYGGTVPRLAVANRRDHRRFRSRPAIPRAIRQRILERDSHTCQSCGSTETPSLDHIYPYSLGGADTEENLRVLCGPCNQRKGARS